MKQEERKEKSKEEIYQAALEEFGTYGYDNVSIEQICNRHGISKGMMYHYYKGKDDLFLASVSRVFKDLNDYLESKLPDFKEMDSIEAIKSFLMARECFFQTREREKTLFECAIFHHPRPLASQLDEARMQVKELNKSFILAQTDKMKLRDGLVRQHVYRYLSSINYAQTDKMKLRDGLVRQHVYRYLSSINYLFQDLLRNYEDGKELSIHDMLSSAGELLSMMLFGVIDR